MQLFGKTSRIFLGAMVAFFLVFTYGSQTAHGLYLDFDSVDAYNAPGGYVEATNYLAAMGVTLTNYNPAATVAIYDYRKFFDVIPPSTPNFITMIGSNDPDSYRLTFATPLESLSFTRTRLVDNGGLAYPEWQVTVYNPEGVAGPSVGDSLRGYYGDNPAATYTLAIPGDVVQSVVVYSNNYHYAGMSAVTLDDFRGTEVPISSTVLLFGSGMLGLVGLRRFRKE